VERISSPNLDEHERVEVATVPVGELTGKVLSGEIFSSSGVAAVMLALHRLERSGEVR